MLEYKPVGMNDPDYARFFTQARVVAWQYGFALLAHGTYTRDLDLLMVPWEARAFEGAVQPVINRIAQVTGTKIKGEPSAKPHGRRAWTLYLPGENEVRWVDLSVMPCIAAPPSRAAAGEEGSDEKNLAANLGGSLKESKP